MGLIPCSLVLLLFVWCISRCLFFLPDGSIATDFPDVWGDWSLHAAHSWWFAEQPFLRWFDPRILRFDETFSYPPLINLLSGLLLRAGFGFQAAMILPCLMFAAILGFSLNYLFRWAGASPWAAGVLSVLIFLSGGTRVIAALVSGAIPSLFEAASGGIKSGPLSQVWLTPLFSLLLPQRTFLAGLALGVATLLVVLHMGHSHRHLHLHHHLHLHLHHHFSPRAAMVALLILLPGLALAHVYSFLVLSLVILVTMVTDSVTDGGHSPPAIRAVLRHWMTIAGPGLIVAMLMILITMPAIGSKVSGLDWAPGWMASETGQSIFLFWIVNWNVIVPLVIIAGVTSKEFRRDPCFLAGAIIFAAMNAFKLQPWAWDNSKLLMWALLLFSIPLVRFFSQLKFKPTAAVALVIVSLDGVTNLIGQVVAPKAPLVLWTSGEQAIAGWARNHLPLDALILSPSHEDHRYWSFSLTGRTNVQAYGGWIWTHGLSVEPLQSRISIMLEKPAASLDAMRGMGITHIAVPDLGGGVKIGFDELNKSFKPLISFDNQTIFQVP